MVAGARTPRRDRVAIAGSIAIHLCVLAALAVLPRASFPTEDPDERTLLTTVLRIEHVVPPPPPAAQRQVAQTAPAPPAERPVIHAAVTVEHAARRLVVATEHRAGSSAPAPVAPRRAERQRAVTVTQVAAAQPVVANAATPAPAASPAPSPVAAQREEGIGNFGETYPAAIEPALRGTLVAGMNGVVVRIAVDENGRATSIEFVRAPSDPGQRDELRSRLLAAHFIPAACNGLRCAGTVELRS